MKEAFVVKSDGWAKTIGPLSGSKTFCKAANWLFTTGSWQVTHTCSRGTADSHPGRGESSWFAEYAPLRHTGQGFHTGMGHSADGHRTPLWVS